MSPSSLRLRLLLGAALAIFAALAVAWMAMTLLFARHTERRVVAELTRAGMQLVAALEPGSTAAPDLDDIALDPRFDLPASGLYWQLDAPGRSFHSRSLWDESLPATTADAREWSTRRFTGPFGQRVLAVARSVRADPAPGSIHIQLAIDTRELLQARAEFGRDLSFFLGVLWLVLMLAAGLQVQLGLRPLRRLQHDLHDLQRSPAARLAAEHPREVAALVAAINTLADMRERDLVRARRRAADLAHSLKTPLSALAAQARRAHEEGAPAAAAGLERAIAAAAAAVETELARSRAAAMRDRHRGEHSFPQAIAERVIGVLERTDAGEKIIFDVDIDAALVLAVAPDDLSEIFGALLENAARFAHRRVSISAREDANGVAVQVDDDGDGLDIAVETALLRGGRLDESGHQHHGLGLAIVGDLVEASGGELDLGSSALGGLCVHIRWPGAPAAR